MYFFWDKLIYPFNIKKKNNIFLDMYYRAQACFVWTTNLSYVDEI